MKEWLCSMKAAGWMVGWFGEFYASDASSVTLVEAWFI